MTNPVVTNVVQDSTGAPIKNAIVTILLVGAPGFNGNTEIVAQTTVTADATGTWSAAHVPNALISPANTYYKAIEQGGGSWTYVVPNGAGPYQLNAILTVAPGSPAASLGMVRYDTSQPLTAGQKAQARLNTGAYAAAQTGLNVYVYGDSYTLLPPPVSATFSYLTDFQTKIGAPSLTTYGLGGRRIVDMAWNAINEAAAPGTLGPVAGSKWPGSSRSGLVVVDTGTNDIAHGASGNVPAPITTANNNYREGLKSCLRTLLALVSSASRIEESSFVAPTDTWNPTAQTYYSNGSLYYTTTPGRRLTYSITPPQVGPLAGKAYLLTYALDPSAGTNAALTIAIDGGAANPVTITPWEQYIGNAGSNIFFIPTVITVNLPIDGNAHTVTLAHNGSAGQLLYTDCAIVPSEKPPPICILEAPVPVANAGGWTAAQVATWKANAAVVKADQKSVVAEFGNAIWVPTSMTANGVWSGDGIHPNDRGMYQRSSDLLNAVQAIKAQLDGLALSAQPDANFSSI